MSSPDILGGFREVDRSADPDSLVAYLAGATALSGVAPYLHETVRLLDLAQGDSVLEVGCGAGDDVLALAPLIGQAGRMTGVDLSETMVATARHRAKERGLLAEFLVGDAHQLAFSDGTFDACRAVRTYQHLAEPQKALLEMVRVVRRGGRVVVAEPDQETLIVDSPDRALTRTLLNCRCDSIRNGWIGRQLPRLFHTARLEQITIHSALLPVTNYRDGYAHGLSQAVQAAEQAGAVTQSLIERWLSQLQEADRAGEFFMAWTMIVVTGRKP